MGTTTRRPTTTTTRRTTTTTTTTTRRPTTTLRPPPPPSTPVPQTQNATAVNSQEYDDYDYDYTPEEPLSSDDYSYLYYQEYYDDFNNHNHPGATEKIKITKA